jgi:hypothetical protein
MTSQTVKALRTDTPGNSLAIWLVFHHPDLFVTIFNKARATQLASAARGMGRFAQDDGGGVTTAFDTGTTTTFDTSSALPAPDLSSFTSPGLVDVAIDPSALTVPSNLITDTTPSGQGTLSQASNTPTSSGSTVGSTVSASGSSILGALGSVGNFLTSSAGLTSLANVAKAYFTAAGQTSNAQTQAAILQTQLNRAKTGTTAAPITYTVGPTGQLQPVYATQTPQGTVYTPLTTAGLASLTPSSLSVFFSQYGMWLLLGLVGIVGASALS